DSGAGARSWLPKSRAIAMKIADDVKSSADSFIAIARLFGSHDLAPAPESQRVDTNQEDQSSIDLPKAGFKRFRQRQTDQPNLNAVDFDWRRGWFFVLPVGDFERTLHGARENSTRLLSCATSVVEELTYCNARCYIALR